MAGVACVSALRNALDIPASIKWPNDILIDGKKAGGILTEMSSKMGRVNFIVLGIGINVNMDISVLPSDIRSIVTTLKDKMGSDLQRIEVLSSILSELDRWYGILLQNGIRPIIDEWKRFSIGLGERVRIASSDKVIEGIAEGIDDYGRLLLRLNNRKIMKISSGDVTIIR